MSYQIILSVSSRARRIASFLSFGLIPKRRRYYQTYQSFSESSAASVAAAFDDARKAGHDSAALVFVKRV